jgi:hypothetical protein
VEETNFPKSRSLKLIWTVGRQGHVSADKQLSESMDYPVNLKCCCKSVKKSPEALKPGVDPDHWRQGHVCRQIASDSESTVWENGGVKCFGSRTPEGKVRVDLDHL